MRARKKPVEVEVFHWTGGPDQEEDPQWMVDRIRREEIFFDSGHMFIKTLEGVMEARPGDWIIQGVKGEVYPCKPDIFAATYEVVS